jgi:hypothetical protein
MTETVVTTEATTKLVEAIVAARAMAETILEKGRTATMESHIEFGRLVDLIIVASVDCIDEAKTNPRLRRLLATILELSDSCNKFRAAVASGNGIQQCREWEIIRAVSPRFADVLKCLEVLDQPEESFPELETPQELASQEVPPRSICHIYDFKGNGPFSKNGAPNLELLKKELAQPGSVLVPGSWTDPRQLQRDEDGAAEFKKLRRLLPEASAANYRRADAEARGETVNA